MYALCFSEIGVEEEGRDGMMGEGNGMNMILYYTFWNCIMAVVLSSLIEDLPSSRDLVCL